MTSYSGNLRGEGVRVAIACGRFNDLITERLLAGVRYGDRESARVSEPDRELP